MSSMCKIPLRDNHELAGALESTEHNRENTERSGLSFASLQSCQGVLTRNKDFFENQ